MKKILSIVLILVIIFSVGAIIVSYKDDGGNNINQTQELSDEEKIRQAVIDRSRLYWFGSYIGGNEIKSSIATVTNLSWSGEDTCIVSGVMQKTDIYGTVWINNYDCTVTTSDGGETWKAGNLIIKNEYWSKQK